MVAHTRLLDHVEVVMYLDEDDPDSHGLDDPRLRITKTIGPRLTMGAYNSACLDKAGGEIIMLVNDDMVIRTKDWDEKVRALDSRVADKIYLGYVNDLFKGRKLATFPILSRRTCEVLVNPFPESYRGAFIDYHLLDIFKRLEHAGYDRICYLEEVIFEHLHYRTGKAEFDETYRKRNRFADDEIFVAHIRTRSGAAKRLRQAIDGGAVAAYMPEPGAFVAPANLRSALIEYWKMIFRDDELPYRWRGFLYAWFIGRYLASKSYPGGSENAGRDS